MAHTNGRQVAGRVPSEVLTAVVDTASGSTGRGQAEVRASIGGDGEGVTTRAATPSTEPGPSGTGPSGTLERVPDLEAIRQSVLERSGELQQVIGSVTAELDLLMRILEVLDVGTGDTAQTGPSRDRRRRPAARERARPARARETRAEQALRLLAEQRALTSGELARAMEIDPQYVYRVLPNLLRAGKVVKTGRTYVLPEHPLDADRPAAAS